MQFLRNAWYVAARSEEVGRDPLDRTFLHQPVVLFRKMDGTPVALHDRCAHRFAPLSRGRLEGDHLRCAYHGLAYDSRGACVHNPHGPSIPKRAVVKTYPLVERFGHVWIWMGEPERADPDTLPDLAPFDQEDRIRQGGYLRIRAHYQLIVDNLLDLSHVEYLHPAFTSDGALPNTRHEVFERAGALHSNRWKPACRISPLLTRCWGRGPGVVGDARSCMRWHAPSTMYLEIGATEPGADVRQGVTLPILHLLTPESETSTHYFWSVTRDRRNTDPELSAWLQSTLADAFIQEDEPMIEAQQARIGDGIDIMSLSPVLLGPDAGPVQARRMLARLLAAEQEQVLAAPASPRDPRPISIPLVPSLGESS